MLIKVNMNTGTGNATFDGNVSTPGVVFGTPAGDVTSKTLDDYEEGTFTPVFRDIGTMALN